MRTLSLFFLVSSCLAIAGVKSPPAAGELTPAEIAAGGLSLFDGETTFGWKIEGEATVKDGILTLGGTKDTRAACTTQFGYGNVHFAAFTDDAKDCKLIFNAYNGPFVHVAPPREEGWHHFHTQVNPVPTEGPPSGTDDISVWARGSKGFGIQGKFAGPTTIGFQVPAGQKLKLRSVRFKPRDTKSIFNGNDLNGWKEFAGKKSKFTVTATGELNVKDGPGDLQTERQWDDFILQFDCKSHGKHLNSGLFFRCLPGQYQQGYEAQIRNQWEGEDRNKAVDFGTGAIYRRQPARRVVSTDGEWFTMTIVARGNRLCTWVNGYQVTDWLDDRPVHENARQGCKLDKGALSIQGHDPTTNLSFRNFRIVELTQPRKEN